MRPGDEARKPVKPMRPADLDDGAWAPNIAENKPSGETAFHVLLEAALITRDPCS